MDEPKKPTIGRVVHFVDVNGKHVAGLVADTFGSLTIDLITFHVTGDKVTRTQLSVPHAEASESKPLTWHWPERYGVDSD